MENKKVAIIGSGISGIFLAWLLERSGFKVTLIEKLPNIGMDAHGLELEIDGTPTKIDVPLRVFNPSNWQKLHQLIKILGLNSNVIDVSHSVSNLKGETIFCYHQIKFGDLLFPYFNRFKYFDRDVFRVFSEVLYFVVKTKTKREMKLLDQSFDQYLSSLNLSETFRYKYIYPVLQTICTCSFETVKNFPAKIIISSLQNIIGYNLRRVDGGTESIVRKLTSNLNGILTSTSVKNLELLENSVRLSTENGQNLEFDHVVFATQANHINKMLPHGFEQEKNILAQFPYEKVNIYVHSDDRFMPSKKQDWVPLNFMVPDKQGSAMSTTWMNLFDKKLKGKTPVFQTIAPVFLPKDELIMSEIRMERAVVGVKQKTAFEKLMQIHQENNRRVWFCGSYANDSLPLLESGVISSLRIAKNLDAEIPEELNS